MKISQENLYIDMGIKGQYYFPSKPSFSLSLPVTAVTNHTRPQTNFFSFASEFLVNVSMTILRFLFPPWLVEYKFSRRCRRSNAFSRILQQVLVRLVSISRIARITKLFHTVRLVLVNLFGRTNGVHSTPSSLRPYLSLF